MFVKVLDGLYAGEIRDFAPHIAKELIAAGRAQNPYAEPAVTVLPVAGTSHVGSVKPEKVMKRVGGRR